MSTKIPCAVIVFYNADIIFKTVEFLLHYSDRLDITVIENKSIHTDSLIKPYMLKLVKEKKISHYVLFEQNITMNAFRVTFEHGVIDLSGNEYVLITDGDLIVNNSDFLSEQLAIMTHHPEVFACGVSLSKHNLPLNIYPNAGTWIPNDFNEYEDYFEAVTGFHLTLMRAEPFLDYLTYSKRMNHKILDVFMHQYCYGVLGQKWARTKVSEAIHLTWDVYADSSHPYQQWKSTLDLYHHFVHDRYCPFEVFSS
jgi:hypothetical protein